MISFFIFIGASALSLLRDIEYDNQAYTESKYPCMNGSVSAKSMKHSYTRLIKNHKEWGWKDPDDFLSFLSITVL